MTPKEYAESAALELTRAAVAELHRAAEDLLVGRYIEATVSVGELSRLLELTSMVLAMTVATDLDEMDSKQVAALLEAGREGWMSTHLFGRVLSDASTGTLQLVAHILDAKKEGRL